MIFVTVELHTMCHFTQFAIYPYIEISFLAYLFEKFFVMSFTRTDQWCEQVYLLSFIIFQNQIQNLFLRIFHHLLTRQVRIGNTCTGIKQTKIIVYLRCCSYSGTGIFIRRLLFNGNNRTQTGYFIDIRTFQIPQAVAGIG